MRSSKSICALYIRLSQEDKNIKNNNSVSVEYQKNMLYEYCQSHNLIIYKIYIDDGYSGKDFERPAFKEMMIDLEKKNFNTIIVKDLSRIGRNMIKVGQLIEEYLPINKIRFISVLENYDSLKDNDDSYVLKSFINDRYLKECRKKANKTYDFLSTRKDICAEPPYGYKLDENKKMIIDPYAASIVKLIFTKYADGITTKELKYYFKTNKILIPSQYKSINKIHKHKELQNKYDWSSTTIRQILKNKEYTGVGLNMYYSKRNDAVPVELENAHPAIIDKELFDKANSMRKIKAFYAKEDINDIRLFKVFYHNDKVLTYIRENPIKQVKAYYFNKKDHFIIKSDFLHKILENDLKQLIKLIEINDDKTIVKLLSSDNENSINMRKESLTKELYIVNQSIKKIFEQYALEKITLEEYKIISKSLNEKVIQLENELKLISVNQHSKHITKKQIESFKKKIKSISKEEINIPLLQTIYKRVDIIKNELKITYFMGGTH